MIPSFDSQLHLDRGELIGGRYEVLRRIARGGMGEVWAVRHRTLQEEFAIKLLAPVCGIGDDTLSRFALEARVGATLGRKSHYIVPVIDHGEHDGRPYLVMPLIEGPSVEDYLVTGPFDRVHAARIVRHVARALTTAHAEGILHRDLKAGNVLLEEEDGRIFARVTDFGIAKLAHAIHAVTEHSTVRGTLMGTPVNMSPEQANGFEVDERCDVWALSCLAYRCLLGRDAFTGRSALQVFGRICSSTYDAPTTIDAALPAAVDAVFTRAFAGDIEERFTTAAGFADAFSQSLGVATRTLPMPPERLTPVGAR